MFDFFFFKQKTAYEIGVRLVGSEMCIRDRTTRVSNLVAWQSTNSACRPVKGIESARGDVLTKLPREIQRVRR